ncbi:FG-GAP repeat protein [Nonomuraea sp. K274]|uniref:FG-GAP repeat protein n=1 Tax=Nonomuraea cypriaca TaxID=1187855 RepID=A0A931AKM5_9ACTN|nr:FG-GAP repeat protein [Nonomuraea cypriaca]MBF8193485.1 FG-GAP repeat protein [Nonomuraea cypriaca]
MAAITLFFAISACELGAGNSAAPPPSASPSTAAPAGDCSKASARDFDGDGQDDVAVGNRILLGGQVSLLTAGRLVPLTIPDEAADAIGGSVALARVNADGCADLIVGAPYTKVDGKGTAGAVYVLYGGNALPARKIVSPRPQEGARFGTSVAAYGDLIAVGAPEEDDHGAAQAGAVYVVGEGTEPIRVTQDTEGVPGNSEQYDGFGRTIALGPLAGGRIALVVGAPRERQDGSGRQRGTAGGGFDGAVTVIPDVRASELEATKHDGRPGCAYGDAVAYLPGGRWAATAGRCGEVYVHDHAGVVDSFQCRACVVSGTSRSALAAAPDGRLAVAWGDSALVMSPEEGGRDLVVPTLPGGNWPVAFYGTRLVFGTPHETPPQGVTVFDPATGKNESLKSPIGDVEGIGEALG